MIAQAACATEVCITSACSNSKELHLDPAKPTCMTIAQRLLVVPSRHSKLEPSFGLEKELVSLDGSKTKREPMRLDPRALSYLSFVG